ncbi:hypothetical protein [Bradyrhizobium sp. SZCCHNS3053]|uniref:hypothetical protein n=1 Tax=Bradyrhizobium sp. SZCCHNS3053 TaxID=3057322 RepID=UPI002916D512|nr:hypothetical protein [Bradyrhizobium sp. SZCCHNS3053]
MTIETRINRVRRVLGASAELAKQTKTINWRFDHGHLVGDTPSVNGRGEPILHKEGWQAGKPKLVEHDIVCVVSQSTHVVRKVPPYDRSRIDIRYMASIEPQKLLQLQEDIEAIIADYEARIAELQKS